MKCPYCNKEMWHPIGKPTWSCQNWDCMESEGMIGNHVLWQALIDTKKKLDTARSAIKYIVDGNLGVSPIIQDFAEKLLEQIKDNDKDVK